MVPIWHETFKVKSYDVDSEQKLKLPSLFSYLQEAAGNHAENISVGFDGLMQKHLFWVLSRMKIVIHAMPRWNDEIVVYTWPKGIDKMFAMRDFEIKNTDGKLLISATSGWLLIDTIKNRLHKIEELNIPIPDNGGKQAITESLEKIYPLAGSFTEHNHYVTYSELDMLHHVNNTRYSAWITDCYEPAQFAEKSIKSIQINYLEEARFKETLRIRHLNNSSVHYFEGLKEGSLNKAFQALVEWV